MPWWFYWPSLVIAVAFGAGVAFTTTFGFGVLVGLFLAAVLHWGAYGFWPGSRNWRSLMMRRLTERPEYQDPERYFSGSDRM